MPDHVPGIRELGGAITVRKRGIVNPKIERSAALRVGVIKALRRIVEVNR